jgi:hypothetical protein
LGFRNETPWGKGHNAFVTPFGLNRLRTCQIDCCLCFNYASLIVGLADTKKRLSARYPVADLDENSFYWPFGKRTNRTALFGCNRAECFNWFSERLGFDHRRRNFARLCLSFWRSLIPLSFA